MRPNTSGVPEDATDTLLRALKPFARRLRSQRALRVGLVSGVVLLPAAAALATWLGWWGAVPLLTWVIVVSVAWLWPLREGAPARFADASMGLHAAADTALHLAAQSHPAADALAQDAVDALAGRPLPATEWPARMWLLPLLVLLAVAPRGVMGILPAPEPAGPATEELLDELDRIEADALLKGQDDLVDAVRDLRSQVLQVQPTPRAIRRHEPPPAPEPTPETPVLQPKPPPMLPPDVESVEEFEEILQQAQVGLAADEELLDEFQAALEQHLMQVSYFEDLGNNMLRETINATEMQQDMFDGGLAEQEAWADLGENFNRMQDDNELNEIVPQTQTPGVEDMVEGRDVGTEQHELAAAIKQSYQDFLKEYAETMREELSKALTEMAEQGTLPGEETDTPGDGPSISGGEPPDGQKADGSAQARIRPGSGEPAEGSEAMAASADAQGNGTGRGAGSRGGSEAPRQDGAQAGVVEGGVQRLDGQFGPGSMPPEQEDALFEGVAERSMVTGPGSEFDDQWDGYFAEAERTLDEEELPPEMEQLVRAYLQGLKEGQ